MPSAAAVLETAALVLALLPVLLLLASGPALLHPRARHGPNLGALGTGVVLAVALPLGWRVGIDGRGTAAGVAAVVVLLLGAQVGSVLAVLLLRWGWLAWSVHRNPPTRADALVVLGAGLVGTRVTLVLAERLLAAVRLHGSLALPGGRLPQSADRPPRSGDRPPRSGDRPTRDSERRRVPLVVSGGQGPDEITSEAAAMAAFLVEHDVDPAAILLEDRSASTWENLGNSAALVASRVAAPGGAGAPSASAVRMVVVTNGFHVVRTDLWARALRLDVVVVGCPTPLHYLPRSLVRELVAVLLLHPRRQLVAAILLTALGVRLGLG